MYVCPSGIGCLSAPIPVYLIGQSVSGPRSQTGAAMDHAAMQTTQVMVKCDAHILPNNWWEFSNTSPFMHFIKSQIYRSEWQCVCDES